MKLILASIIFVLLIPTHIASSQEVIIWRDAEGDIHAAKGLDEIPEKFRPKAETAAPGGVLTVLDPADVRQALTEGKALGARPELYVGGLGLYQPFRYELDGNEGEAYVFVGTKYNLLKARAAVEAARMRDVPKVYMDKVQALHRLPVSFYARGFKPALLLLRQEDTVVKGKEGFGDADPGLAVSMVAMSYPYDALDFTKPVEVEVFDIDGNSISFEVDLPAMK